MQMNSYSKKWSTIKVDNLLDQLNVLPSVGLTEYEAKHRLQIYGANILKKKKPKNIFFILWQQLKSIIVLLLFCASLISFFLNDWAEGAAILAVLVINTFVGFLMEYRAARSMEALRQMGHTITTVLRNGETIQVDAEELVPGDIIFIEAGDIVTADMRLLESSKLSADESALTGESIPVDKRVDIFTSEPILSERVNMLFKGTSVTNGSGKAVVVSTGMNTELGHIAKLTFEAEDEITPLEKRLDILGHRLVIFSLGLVGVIAIVGIVVGKEVELMLETSVALAVATIPEGLPIVATIALAKGMWRMAKKNALINRLSAVETLGATTVILTDKTGTLTENKMTVNAYQLSDGFVDFKPNNSKLNANHVYLDTKRKNLDLALRIGVLCSNASLGKNSKSKPIGDPIEIALLNAGRAVNIEKEDLLKKYPEVLEEAFDPLSRMMATLHKNNGDYFLAVKGAPEALISASERQQNSEGVETLTDHSRKKWLKYNENLAQKGYRVLGLAYRANIKKSEPFYEDLTFVGLVGLTDPPRGGVAEAIQNCQDAGIRVIMITGDQKATAYSIGEELGLQKKDIFSRVSPHEKLEMVRKFQKQGAIVAMTGDGVNDAPALKKADIGLAMGERGTQVAREAADIVLKDDNFKTIVTAILQGRVVFSNIRRFVIYLLSCNISEVLVVTVATVINAPLPILPMQILFLNLVTDVFPALALGMGEGDDTYLKHPPRKPDEPMVTPKIWWAIGGYGLLMTTIVLASFVGAFKFLHVDKSKAVTISFLTLAFSQVFHVFNMRDKKSNFISNDIVKNPHIWGAVILCVVLLVLSIHLEFLNKILSLVPLNMTEWIWTIMWSISLFFIGQLIKQFNFESISKMYLSLQK